MHKDPPAPSIPAIIDFLRDFHGANVISRLAAVNAVAAFQSSDALP